MEELARLLPGQAIQLQLDGRSYTSVRAGVGQAAYRAGIKIATRRDGNCLWVWKKVSDE
jgi:hypothetical protein